MTRGTVPTFPYQPQAVAPELPIGFRFSRHRTLTQSPSHEVRCARRGTRGGPPLLLLVPVPSAFPWQQCVSRLISILKSDTRTVRRLCSARVLSHVPSQLRSHL